MAGPLGERGGPVKRSLIWRKDLAESRGSLAMLSSPPEPPAKSKKKPALYNVPYHYVISRSVLFRSSSC